MSTKNFFNFNCAVIFSCSSFPLGHQTWHLSSFLSQEKGQRRQCSHILTTLTLIWGPKLWMHLNYINTIEYFSLLKLYHFQFPPTSHQDKILALHFLTHLLVSIFALVHLDLEEEAHQTKLIFSTLTGCKNICWKEPTIYVIW